MFIKTIKKACFLTMFIGFGILPSLSWGGDVTSMSKGTIGRIDKDGRIYDGSNSFIGRFDKEEGDITSMSKGTIARIEKDGRIYDGSNSFIGRFDKEEGDITSMSKGTIGRIGKDGRVYDGSNSFIGRVDPGDIVGALYLLKDKF